MNQITHYTLIVKCLGGDSRLVAVNVQDDQIAVTKQTYSYIHVLQSVPATKFMLYSPKL